MGESETTSPELLVDLTARSEATKSGRLQGALRAAIRSGRLEAGRRLPSSRALAADLGVSRGVVVEAYDQLVAEGYLTSRHGSGTAVAAVVGGHRTDDLRVPPHRRWRVDFDPGRPDLDSFPRSAWSAAVRSALAELTAAELGYRDAPADEVLAAELASYLRRVRGADIVADGLFVVGGFTQGLGLMARALRAAGHATIAVEDPGAYVQRQIVAAAAVTPRGCPVDEHGIVTERVAATGADVVMATPAHQYPLGVVMAPERRVALLEWARQRPARLVIEDDYDAEFRYDRSPVGCLQGLAPDVVVLGGSVSKALAPGIRLGWFAPPAALVEAVAELQATMMLYPTIVTQRAFAHLIRSGRYDRHIRRMRARYRSRRDTLVEILSGLDGIEVQGVSAGLHLVVTPPPGCDVSAVLGEVEGAGVYVQRLDRYFVDGGGSPGLVMGYAHLTPDQIATGARVVVEAISRAGA